MVSSTRNSTLSSQAGPAWEIARLYPDQGQWTEGDYLTLNRTTNRLIELADGQVEILPMPTRSHQRSVLFLRDELTAFADPRGLGEVLVAPFPVLLSANRFREPDVLFMLTEHQDRMHEEFAEGADLVMEVLSEDRDRDLVTKRREYADAGVPEYWLIDLRDRRITVLHLKGGQYVVHGESTSGRATSALLAGFEIDTDALWAHAFR